MKRFSRVLAALLIAVTLFTLLPTVNAEATELKTAVGIVNCNGLRLRAKPNTDADILATAKRGDYVVVIRKVGEWYLVDYNLQNGYMHEDYLKLKDRENVELGYGTVNPAVCNMRSKPSTSSSIVDQVSRNEKVFIFGFNCGWYKVKYDGQIGYIRSDLVSLQEKPYENSGKASSSSSGSSSSSSSSSSGSTSAYVSAGQKIAATAQKYVGYPYVWGGTSPSGFDCSGFVQYVYKLYGYSLNRTCPAQLSNGYSVSKANLQPGDIVFFENTYASSAAATHVGIYIGNDKFVHAANSRYGVIVSNLSDSYYSSRYVGARRIVG